MSDATAVVLAAGKGTRMQSDLPKVLCRVLGKPMIHYVLDALQAAGIRRTLVVVGYRAELVEEALANYEGLEFVEQTEQLGTGHAVRCCSDRLQSAAGAVAIVTGDSPLIQPSSLRTLRETYEKDRASCVLGTLHKPDPKGLGRIVRDDQQQFVGIVEERDASESQRAITEVNMSTYVFHGPDLLFALERMSNDNRQGEYYITDCPGILLAAGKDVRALPVLQPCEAMSVNTIDELAAVEAELRTMSR